MSAASPDGLVGNDGMLELKCPTTATHIETLLTKGIADKYVVQMQWQMACAGRAWCDYASFDPRMTPDLQLFIQRVGRDDQRIAALASAVVEFLGDIRETITTITGRKAEVPATPPTLRGAAGQRA